MFKLNASVGRVAFVIRDVSSHTGCSVLRGEGYY